MQRGNQIVAWEFDRFGLLSEPAEGDGRGARHANRQNLSPKLASVLE